LKFVDEFLRIFQSIVNERKSDQLFWKLESSNLQHIHILKLESESLFFSSFILHFRKSLFILIFKHAFQTIHDLWVIFQKFAEFWISESQGMIDNEDIFISRDVLGCSYFILLVILVVHDFEKLTPIISGIGKFEMKGFNEAGRKLRAYHLNSVEDIKLFGFRRKLLDGVVWDIGNR